MARCARQVAAPIKCPRRANPAGLGFATRVACCQRALCPMSVREALPRALPDQNLSCTLLGCPSINVGSDSSSQSIESVLADLSQREGLLGGLPFQGFMDGPGGAGSGPCSKRRRMDAQVGMLGALDGCVSASSAAALPALLSRRCCPAGAPPLFRRYGSHGPLLVGAALQDAQKQLTQVQDISLCCSEAQEALEECTSLGPAARQGSVACESLLSLQPQPHNHPAPDAAQALPQQAVALSSQSLPPLASDPDLAEMLGCGAMAGHFCDPSSCLCQPSASAAAPECVLLPTLSLRSVPACCSLLFDSEAELQPSPSYLEDNHGRRALPQHALDARCRGMAASWLSEVATEYGLHQETLFLGVALLDRFLSATKVRASCRMPGSRPVLRWAWVTWARGPNPAPLARLSLHRRACQTPSCSWWLWPACWLPPSMRR